MFPGASICRGRTTKLGTNMESCLTTDNYANQQRNLAAFEPILETLAVVSPSIEPIDGGCSSSDALAKCQQRAEEAGSAPGGPSRDLLGPR